MMLPYNAKIKPFSRSLRSRMTDAEEFIWARVRRKQLGGRQFYRQKIIGNYIVDFYCPSAKLVVEIDGGQHYHGEGKRKDAERSSFLKSKGLKVLRFSDREVFEETEGVLNKIYQFLNGEQTG